MPFSEYVGSMTQPVFPLTRLLVVTEFHVGGFSRWVQKKKIKPGRPGGYILYGGT
jgi:hypothetical protein